MTQNSQGDPVAEAVAIPSSLQAKRSTSPGANAHISISPKSLAEKPHQSSPPHPKSPMPPTATLTAAGAEMLDLDKLELEQKNGKGRGDGDDDQKSTVTGSLNRIGGEALPSSGGSAPIPSPPAEVEATLSKLTSHANVTGVLVLSRPEALVIRSGGAYFEPSGPGARERAMRLKTVVDMVRNVVVGLEKDIPKSEVGDELSFLRIRTKKYEMMISPSDKYLLVVLQVCRWGTEKRLGGVCY
jgi:dynein light chain roadblock-type